MKNLPKKPIEKACVYFAGERAAGINAVTFNLDVFIDLNCLADDSQAEHLANCRTKIADAYEEMAGEPPSWVMFDFEWESQNKADDESAKAQEEAERLDSLAILENIGT